MYLLCIVSCLLCVSFHLLFVDDAVVRRTLVLIAIAASFVFVVAMFHKFLLYWRYIVYNFCPWSVSHHHRRCECAPERSTTSVQSPEVGSDRKKLKKAKSGQGERVTNVTGPPSDQNTTTAGFPPHTFRLSGVAKADLFVQKRWAPHKKQALAHRSQPTSESTNIGSLKRIYMNGGAKRNILRLQR